MAQVAVPFACGLFSSAGRFYRSSSVFEVLDQVFLPPASGRSFIGGASAWFCLLLWLTAVSLTCGLAFAVLRGVADFSAGIDGCLSSSPSGVEVGSFSYTLAYSRLDFGFV